MATRSYPTTPMCDGTLLETFEPTTRPTDVFVATAAKCGQTWLLALLHHLRTQGRDPTFGGLGAMGVTPWLEQPRNMTTGEMYVRETRLAQIAALPDPRVFKMHVIYEEVPRPPGSSAKVVTITRDPRDVPYSMYAHLAGMRPELFPGPLPPFETWFETWFENGWYYKVVRSFWPHRDDGDLLWLRFEDLKADLRQEARRCVDFLGWTVDDAALDRAVALCDLKHMQASESTLATRGAFKEGHQFVREGAIGKNRARLSDEQERRIVQRARQEFEPACFEFVMSQGA